MALAKMPAAPYKSHTRFRNCYYNSIMRGFPSSQDKAPTYLQPLSVPTSLLRYTLFMHASSFPSLWKPLLIHADLPTTGHAA
jgi:hypothetical protein